MSTPLYYHFDWEVLWRFRHELLAAYLTTLALSAAGLGGALVLGVPIGVLATGRRRWPRAIAAVYVEAARDVPLLIHMYFWYLGLSMLRLPSFLCAVLALSMYCGAFIAEVVRSGLQSVPVGQYDAGVALGMKPARVFRLITLPQAMAFVAPSLASVFSQLIKDSSLSSVISVAELTFTAGAIEGATFRTFEAYIGITAFYLMTVTLVTRSAIAVFGGRAYSADLT
ncbi:MAG: amino acid ABC transporter permease [Proteobacteria bacterium]|nr:amino acid ABC transporter permease [Pseudomonadota bacterium]